MKNKNDFEYLDEEEKELIEAIEAADLVSLSTSEEKAFRKMSVTAAKSFFRKEKKINLRLNSHDFSEIKRRAAQEGLPYQTLISSLITKYLNGSLKPAY
mgnify:CR=1 FL=1